MSVFKERRILLLLLAVFLSVMLIWSPWGEADSRVKERLGWLARYTRGLHFGVDIIGGSRIVLALEASHVTIENIRGNVEKTWKDIVLKLEDNLYVSIKTVSFDPAGRTVAEIGRPVTGNLIKTIIGDLGDVANIEKKIAPETCDEVIEILIARVDPAGLRGAQFRSLGKNLVLYEIPGLLPGEAETLLGKLGRLEIFFVGDPLLRGEDIVNVRPPYPSTGRKLTANLPFRLTDKGAEQFSAAAAGKADYPTVIYIDRPTDAIILFDNEILGKLLSLRYDENEKNFKGKTRTGIEYPLKVSAIGTARDELSSQARKFLGQQVGQKIRVLLLGDFPENIIENYKVEPIPRLSGELADEWVKGACGVKSVVTISPGLAADLAAGKTTKSLMVTITRPSLEDAIKEAKNLRVVLSERLPVEIKYESVTSIEARLGSKFLREIVIAGVVALLGVLAFVYFRYRRLLISFTIVGIMLSELILTLGAASALKWAIGLPELGALIIVIGTGVDHQIIITDEVLRGLSQAKAVSLSGRVSRAFTVIFVAVATTIAAMVSLALLGFGAMRGFALITITGLLIAVFVTRPAYARILTAIVMRSVE